MTDNQGISLEMQETFRLNQEMFAPEELRADIKQHIVTGESGMVMLHHPLYISSIYHENLNRLINKSITVKEKAVEEARARGDWGSILGLHERPYRMEVFQTLQAQMTDAEFWKEVSWLWTDSENIWQHLKDWRRVWRSKRPGRETVMDDDERAKLQSLPDVIEIFRGTYLYPWMDQGLSWTLNRDKAVWFAYRYKPKHATASVISGKVRKKNVLAYFDGRSEQEIVMLPERLITDSSKVEELPAESERRQKVSDSG